MFAKSALAAATLGLAVLAPVAHAQQGEGGAQPQQAQKPTPEQVANFQRATRILRAFNTALELDGVQQAVKGKLLTCLYANSLSKISQATGRVLANNPSLDESDPGDFYRAAAGVCGVMFKKAGVQPEGVRQQGGAGAGNDGETGR